MSLSDPGLGSVEPAPSNLYRDVVFSILSESRTREAIFIHELVYSIKSVEIKLCLVRACTSSMEKYRIRHASPDNKNVYPVP